MAIVNPRKDFRRLMAVETCLERLLVGILAAHKAISRTGITLLQKSPSYRVPAVAAQLKTRDRGAAFQSQLVIAATNRSEIPVMMISTLLADACCTIGARDTDEAITTHVADLSNPGPNCKAEESSITIEDSSSRRRTKDSCGSCRKRSRQICQSHLDAAFKKYSSYIKLGRCICRSVLAPTEICCSRERRKRARQLGVAAEDHANSNKKTGKAARSARRSLTTFAVDSDDASIKSIGSRKDTSMVMLGDIEKGPPSEDIHIVVSISGMTCTSCSRKGMNVLNRINGITDPHINFVAGIGRFNLNRQLDPAKIISQFERETGFQCSRIMRGLQKVDVYMSEAEAKELRDQSLAGIDTIQRIDSKTSSITYDPSEIGARSLLSVIPSGKLAARTYDSNLIHDKKRLHQMVLYTTLAAAFTVPVVVLAWSRNPLPHSELSIILLVLATCVQAIAVPEFYVRAMKSLVFSRVVEMDMLVVISITAAYGYSVIAFALTQRGYVLEQGAFFETSSLLVTLILVGRLISTIARMKASTAVSVKSLQPEIAMLDRSGEISQLDARLLEYSDSVVVPPHTSIVTDGEIIDGSSAIDESMVTGETIPVPKQCGNSVMAGTLNGSSQISIRVTRLPGQNSITDIASLVENALEAKPHIQDLADRVASWFIPAMIGIACAVFAIWIAIALKFRNKNVGGSFGLAITYSISVLAVTCPCALGLAVPLVLIIASGVAAKSGIIIKQAYALERAYRTTDVVFDKTGTLTTGILEVVEEEYFHCDSRPIAEVKTLVFSLLKDVPHPVSTAVANRLRTQVSGTFCLENTHSIPGAGLRATWNGTPLKAGNPYWLAIDAHPAITPLLARGHTILAVTLRSELLALYALQSTLRPEAASIIQALHRRKIACHILSGDTAQAVDYVAQTLHIPAQNTASRQTPLEKKSYVSNLIAQGKTVLFCGDGSNDAVAVAQAHIGVQIGATSDLMRATADVVLRGGLDGIPALIDISRRAFVRVVFNFGWAAVYNLFAVLLAAGAFVEVRIPPAYAGLGEIVSVVPLVGVAQLDQFTNLSGVQYLLLSLAHMKPSNMNSLNEIQQANGTHESPHSVEDTSPAPIDDKSIVTSGDDLTLRSGTGNPSVDGATSLMMPNANTSKFLEKRVHWVDRLKRERSRLTASKIADGKAREPVEQGSETPPIGRSKCNEPDTKIGFLTLPGEIRNKIMDLALSPGHVYFSPKMQPVNSKGSPVFVSGCQILAACRQLYQEGHSSFYSRNTFHLAPGPLSASLGYFERLNGTHQNLIERVSIDLSIMDLTPSVLEGIEAAFYEQHGYATAQDIIIFGAAHEFVEKALVDLWTEKIIWACETKSFSMIRLVDTKSVVEFDKPEKEIGLSYSRALHLEGAGIHKLLSSMKLEKEGQSWRAFPHCLEDGVFRGFFKGALLNTIGTLIKLAWKEDPKGSWDIVRRGMSASKIRTEHMDSVNIREQYFWTDESGWGHDTDVVDLERLNRERMNRERLRARNELARTMLRRPR
ncbi:MAG: hypothetical protein Q9195_004717 [Heterodermia aff. obscurata]